MDFESNSVAETQAIAAALAGRLKPGACLALHGELGAGKTQFVRGLVEALGGDPRRVSSPTFVLLHLYPAPRGPIYHLDAYRVGGADDFQAIGFEELLDQGGVVVVEWADRVSDLLPPHCLHISIEHAGGDRRRIHVDESTS